ncbi:MMPL family transporter [Embleya sp. NBC_00896]|uniref:MMPL family transporter n=1 Tax=Embleya sp. NBC_00896 TaxID=2975961 RepID=UPI00386BBDDC|nr:MMPL family transporter [Embleya sp. NBC_00896]
MIQRTTAFATRHRWLTIIVWAIFGLGLTAVGQPLMNSVTDSQTGDFLPKEYDSAAALQIAEKKFDEKPDPNAVTVLVARADGAKLGPQDRKKIADTTAELAKKPIEAEPEQFAEDFSQTPRLAVGMVAPNGTFQLVSLSLAGNMNDTGLQDVYRDARALAKADFEAAGFRVGFTGGLANTVDAAEEAKETEAIVGALTMGLIVLLNVLVFRSILAALLPLLAVALIGGVATGAVAGSAKLLDIKLDPSVPSLITVVLLGIGIDYFLFLLFRFREQLRANPDQDARTAAAATASRVGNAITCAALTIVAAFATLGIATFGQFRVLGPAIAVAVLVALLGSLTLMPAMLAVCGRGMFWPARAWKKERPEGFAARLGVKVSTRPVRYLVGSLALLGALGAGAIGVAMSYDQQGQPRTNAIKVAEEISRSLPAGVSDPHTVYVQSKGGGKLDERSLTGLTGALGKVEGVGQVAAPALNADGSAARIDVFLAAKADTQKARDLISGPVRGTIAENTPEGTEAHITGTAAIFADVAESVDKDLKLVFPVAAILIALILFLLLRSLLAPIVLMIAVGLGFVATLGAATLVFQHGLDRPGVSFTLPLVLFLFVVALGTDYNILMSDRLREEMDKPVPARKAVAEAVKHTAPAIATAGLVLAGSFASLAASPSTAEIGFATALGILLSSMVLSIVLVPAIAAILGRGLWWPRRPKAGRHGDPKGSYESGESGESGGSDGSYGSYGAADSDRTLVTHPAGAYGTAPYAEQGYQNAPYHPLQQPPHQQQPYPPHRQDHPRG